MSHTLITLSLFLLFTACTPPSDPNPSSGQGAPPVNTFEPSIPGDDPLASYAWFLGNTGQDSFSKASGLPGEDLKINNAIALGVTGKGIRIAVSDSGVEADHPDLLDNELKGEHRDYSGNNWHGGSPKPKEKDGHGTAVTGLISAVGWNSVGSRGVAPDSQFAGFYFLGNFHDSMASYEAKVLDQMNGNFDIFNYSYGYYGCRFHKTTNSVNAAYRYGVTYLRGGLGAIYVKAAGNDYMGSNSACRFNDSSSFLGNTNTNEDQNVPYIIVAGAVNAHGRIS